MNLSRNVLKAMIVIAVLACVGLTSASAEDDSTRASQPPAPPAGWTDGYVMANGIRIHYWRTGGNKPVLLMAHGSSECEYWAPSKRLHHPDTALRSRSGRPAMSELFTKITAPTLVLKADAQGADRKKNEEVAKLLKNGKIVHVEDARHNVRRDQKARLLKALKAFLGEL